MATDTTHTYSVNYFIGAKWSHYVLSYNLAEAKSYARMGFEGRITCSNVENNDGKVVFVYKGGK